VAFDGSRDVRYGWGLSVMSRRWKILILVGLSVVVLDQWSKLLAVSHLTNGMEQAIFQGKELVLPREERREAVQKLGPLDELSYFYLAIREPCSKPGSHCPASSVIDGFFEFRYAENPGAAWSLLATTNESVRVPFFISVSIGAIIFILWFFRRLSDDQRLLTLSLSLVFGGALGNFIDRTRLQYVIDFIHFYWRGYSFPTFNIADSAITVGVGLLLLDMLLAREKKPEAAPAAGAGS
jgi:signal peptidase II